MIIDIKRPRDERHPLPAGYTSGTPELEQPEVTSLSPSLALAKHFYIELPTPKLVYTTNSPVSGIVHISEKDPESIQEIKISIVCSVCSRYHKYRGGNSREAHRETTKLFHRDQTLWSRRSVSEMPPSSLPFEIRIPESGIDSKANDNNAFLPPSFYARRHDAVANMIPHARLIGFVKYYAKARIVRKGFFKLNEAVAVPFIFLPPSAPPPLLPLPPESITDQDLGRLTSLWVDDTVTTTIRQGIFSCQGQAELSLWLPRVEKLPRKTSIPFFLCLRLRTDPGKFQKQPPGPLLSSLPRLDRASVYLQQNVRLCARKAIQTHTRTYDQNITDNFVYSVVPQESDWKCISSDPSGPYWEKGYIWRSRWKFQETPNFTSRQLTVKYCLVIKVPFKGLGNDITLISRQLDISTGILAGQSGQTPVAVESELLPGYFEPDAVSDEDEAEQDQYIQEKDQYFQY